MVASCARRSSGTQPSAFSSCAVSGPAPGSTSVTSALSLVVPDDPHLGRRAARSRFDSPSIFGRGRRPATLPWAQRFSGFFRTSSRRAAPRPRSRARRASRRASRGQRLAPWRARRRRAPATSQRASLISASTCAERRRRVALAERLAATSAAISGADAGADSLDRAPRACSSRASPFFTSASSLLDRGRPLARLDVVGDLALVGLERCVASSSAASFFQRRRAEHRLRLGRVDQLARVAVRRREDLVVDHGLART